MLKAKYPEDYAKLRARVSSARGFDDAGEMLGETLGSVTSRQRLKADAVSVRAIFAIRRDEGKALQAVDVAGCAAFMGAGGAPVSLASVITPQLAARDRTAVADLLDQTATRPAPPAPAMSVEDLAQISSRAMKSFTDRDRDLVVDLLRTVRSPVTENESRVMCAYHLALADDLLARPPAEGGALIRSLWALQG